MSNPRPPIIRASEIAEYVYCARSWWFRRVEGLEPEGHERRAFGAAMHRRHGRAVFGSRVLLWLAGVLVLVALLLMMLGH